MMRSSKNFLLWFGALVVVFGILGITFEITTPVFGEDGDVEWMTDYDKAIKEAQESGRMLFIYNGWKDKGI